MGEVQYERGLGKYKIIHEGENVRGYVLKQVNDETYENSVILERHYRDKNGLWVKEKVPFYVRKASLKNEQDRKSCVLFARKRIHPSRAIIYVEVND